MIKSLKGFTLRFFKYNKFIVLSSIISMAISIFLIITLFCFQFTARQKMMEDMKQIYGDMDLSIGYEDHAGKMLDANLYKQIASHDGVEQVSGVTISFLDVQGFGTDLYTIGVENNPLAKSKYHFQQDVLADEIIINQGMADTLKVKENDAVTVEKRPFKVKEIIEEQDAFGIMPDVVIMPKDTLNEMIGSKAVATYLLIKKSPNVDVYALAAQLQNLDSDFRVDIAQENEYQKENLQQLSMFIIVLSILLLVITSLFTLANVDVLLFKYFNEFAIMRSMGATTRQLFQIVWRQGLIMNAVGAVIGILLAFVTQGWIIEKLGGKFFINLSSFKFPIIESLFVTLLCMVFIQLFLIVPSLRATKVLPIRLMQKSEESGKINIKWRIIFASILGFLSLLFIGLGITSSPYPTVMIFCGAFQIIIAIFLLYPIYVSIILNKLLPLFQKMFGNQAFVAVKNMMIQIRKNSFITLTISIFIIISIFGSTLLKTIEVNNEKYLHEQYITDLVLTNRLTAPSMDLKDLRENLTSIAGVEHVSMNSHSSPITMKKNGKEAHLNFSFTDIEEMQLQGLLSKQNSDDVHGIIITENAAKELQVQKGDQVSFGEYSNEFRQYQFNGELMIIDVVEQLPGSYLDIYIDWHDMDYLKSNLEDVSETLNQVYITTNNSEKTRAGFEQLQGKYPELKLHTLEEARSQSNELFNQRWFLFKSVMMIVIFGVLIGIINSFVNDIYTRRKELAILRVISLNVRQIVQIIISQIFLYVCFGVILGIVTGVVFTYTLSLIDPGINFDLPFITIIIGLLVVSVLLVMIPYGFKIGRLRIVYELTRDQT